MIENGYYRCQKCGDLCHSDMTDEEAFAEAEAMNGGPIEDPAIVCDDCYRKMFPGTPEGVN